MEQQRSAGDHEPAGHALDQDSLRALWQEHRRWVAAILIAHKPAWADVDDLLQDVAVAVVRKVGDLRDANALKPWLRAVAINAANAAARGGKKRAASLDVVGEAGIAGRIGEHGVAAGGSEVVRIRDEAARLMELARQLPDGYREPLLMKAVQGMSYREIGEVLNLPETTVETRIARGRKMLRELAEAAESAPVRG